LHEGSGSAAVNAFVEIVFDNGDGRFSLENSDEVVLRRTIGLKKDEFFLQSKRANKTEIQSLLEGAGFSKSNPYFIVQQGKVQDLCTMSDAERLALLKEVAGTTVYDEKKTESLAKMEENSTRIAKIDEILGSIEDRLDELESEKEELTQYQQYDRSRRAMEYTLYDKELRKARSTLDALEQERLDHGQHLSELNNVRIDEEVRNLEGTVKTKHTALKRSRNVLAELEADNKTAVKNVAKLQLEYKELIQLVKSGKEQLLSNQQELKKVDHDIAATTKHLEDEVLPAYNKARSKLQKLTDQRDAAAQQVDALYAKQGRGKAFSTAEERDAHLRSSITELESDLAQKESALSQQRDRLASLRRTMQDAGKERDSTVSKIEQWTSSMTALSKRIDDTQKQRLEKTEVRKEAWRNAEQLQEQVREQRELAKKAASDARKQTPRATSLGLQALETIVREENLVIGTQYFGTVMENLRLKDPRYQTAVEVAAQNSLFHVIVDTDHTASRLMDRLEKEKLGRVTFLPLNQLRVDDAQYPENPDIRPILDLCIEYDPKVEAAMRHVFFKKLLARDANIASEWSTKLGVDAITPDGDLCSRGGAMSGGFVDSNKSRLRAHAALKEAQANLRSLEREYNDANSTAKRTEQEVLNLENEASRLDGKRKELDNLVSRAETDMQRLEQRSSNQKKQAEAIEKTEIPTLERDIATLKADKTRLEEEIGTELTDSLSEKDRALLQKLQQTQDELQPQIEAQNVEVDKLSVQRQKLQSLLEDNLLKRKQELTEAGTDDSNGKAGRRRSSVVKMSSAALQAQRQSDCEEKKTELDDATRIHEEVESRLEQAREQAEQLRNDLETAKNELEKKKNEELKHQKQVQEATERSDRLWNKVRISGHERGSLMFLSMVHFLSFSQFFFATFPSF